MISLMNAWRAKNNMFTGIVKTSGIVTDISEKKKRTYIAVKPKKKLGSVRVGDSVSVNGVCLTISKMEKSGFVFEVMPETKRKTTLAALKKNDIVNLEPALRLSDTLGGHIVQGHVDAVAPVVSVESDGENILVSIKLPNELKRYIIVHGSITFDGISLTVARLKGNIVTVSLIKETVDRTTWKNISVGQLVNAEVDVLGKYVENILNFRKFK